MSELEPKRSTLDFLSSSSPTNLDVDSGGRVCTYAFMSQFNLRVEMSILIYVNCPSRKRMLLAAAMDAANELFFPL